MIKKSIYVYTCILFLISFFSGESIDDNIFRWVSKVSSVVVLIWIAYEKWIWRWSVFRYISELRGTPVIYGTWKGTLFFERDLNGNKGNVDIFMSIKQSLNTISVRSFFVKPSESYSIIAKIEKLQQDRYQLIYFFRSEAPYGKRVKNPPKDGVCVLTITGKRKHKLSGSYFTELNGAGTIKLSHHSLSLAETLEEAEKLKYSKK